MPPKGKRKQGAAGHDGMSVSSEVLTVPSANGALGSGVFCDEQGTPAITDFTALDARVVARLQDIEDHPDIILDAAA